MRAYGELKTHQVIMSADPDCTERFSTQEYREGELGVQSERTFLQACKRWIWLSQNIVETEAGGTGGPASDGCAQVERPPSLTAKQSLSTESIKDTTQYPYTAEFNNVPKFDIAIKEAVPVHTKPSLGSGYCIPKDLINARPGLRSSHASFERASPQEKNVGIIEFNGEPEAKGFWIRRRAYNRLDSCGRQLSGSREEYRLLSS